jgi:hypothetical protein
MDTSLRSLSYVILFVGISAVSALGIIGFLNNAYADNATIGDNVGMNATVNTSTNMTSNTNGNMTGSVNGNMTGSVNGNMTGSVNGNMTVSTSQPPIPKILPPLQQFKSGTSAKSVQCDQGFTLVIKIEDGSPACVSSQIAQELVVRGWGTTA